ncbi:hypothetical protein AXF42_Ash006057 [Apostasia shenzhenica]|uniref:Ectonucleotide pyrophosphatase/phosphodiesterase family member 3 n=1 Tax=Apostasia shenzhenica TaxID=1088818 RepID=A0A2I0B039_9ASPA|nr:hypothetical protein AXF42_Ash006057 [Apostasia shenzhenica]
MAPLSPSVRFAGGERHCANPSVSLLAKPSSSSLSPTKSLIFCIFVVISCVSSAASAAFGFLLFSPSSSRVLHHRFPSPSNSREPLARPLAKLPRPVVVVVSFDGFRFGYHLKAPSPNIRRLIANGTEAEDGLIPVFPSLTFPNHYSMATGLFPPYHGIINNIFADPYSGEWFTTKNHDPKWWLGEPLWLTVARQGYNAATYFWAGSEVKKDSWICPPKFCPKYNSSIPFEERVDAVLGYFDLPTDEIPVLIMLYFEDPDSQGHVYGPDHPEITKAVVRVDQIVGRLVRGLEERGIFDDVTIILLGDHGMAGTCDEKYVFLEELSPWIEIGPDWVMSADSLLTIRPPSGISWEEVVMKVNKGLSSGNVGNGDKLTVFLKEDLPEQFQYAGSDRIPPIVGVVEEGYTVKYKREKRYECGGSHGYDNFLLSMRSFFVAHGPRFPQGQKIPSFQNVEIYNLVTTILNLKGAPNNGSVSFPNSVLLQDA